MKKKLEILTGNKSKTLFLFSPVKETPMNSLILIIFPTLIITFSMKEQVSIKIWNDFTEESIKFRPSSKNIQKKKES